MRLKSIPRLAPGARGLENVGKGHEVGFQSGFVAA